MSNKTLQELVEAFCKNPADSLRNSIISKSMPLVRSIIGKISRPDHPLTQQEDLESAAITGLIQALDNYDCSKNVQFNTYSYYRIRGSVIDYLRSIDYLPKQQRKHYGEVQQVIFSLSQKLGRNPSDDEVAEEMQMDLKEYHTLLSNVQQRNALSLDSFYGVDSSIYETQKNPDSKSPIEQLERSEIIQQLKQKIGGLKQRERLILTLYYFEDMTMSEIALLLDLSEARISQIIGQILIQLKNELLNADIALSA